MAESMLQIMLDHPRPCYFCVMTYRRVSNPVAMAEDHLDHSKCDKDHIPENKTLLAHSRTKITRSYHSLDNPRAHARIVPTVLFFA